jgi:hypothetical protein
MHEAAAAHGVSVAAWLRHAMRQVLSNEAIDSMQKSLLEDYLRRR